MVTIIIRLGPSPPPADFDSRGSCCTLQAMRQL